MGNFSLSANIENGFAKGTEYISTPNAIKVAQSLVSDYATGIHSFTIIGSYGTGKSSFLLALEEDLKCNKNKEILLISPDCLIGKKKVEILNIVGDYKDLSTLIGNALNIGSTTNVLDELRAFYNKLKSQNKFLLIVIDEFGKVLEHAAEHNPEQELYLIQKLAEFINMPQRSAMLITTLHQNFNSYARKLNEAQKNEWTKVKGRFKDIVFVEPIEQVMYLAAKRHNSSKEIKDLNRLKDLQQLCFNCKYVAEGISEETLTTLYPLDPFAAYSITKAIERYGQNERSLFSFMESRGSNSVAEFEPENNLTYNLSCVYDYVIQNFYSYLKDANADSMQWSAINVAMERAETVSWSNEKQHNDAINIIKAIGIMNILGNGTYSVTIQQMAGYAENAMAAKDAIETINKLISKNIVRFAEYKQRLILFEGTDVDIEEEIRKATLKVPRSTNYIDNITLFFNKRITPVKAHFYHKGTPRYFDYLILSEVLDILPTGDTDGYIAYFSQSNPPISVKVTHF